MLWKYACTCITIIIELLILKLVDGLRQLNQQKWIWRLFYKYIVRGKREGIITLVMHILKEPSVLFKLTVGVLLIVNLVVRSLLDYQQPNADQFKQMCISKCCKIVINQFVDCAVYFVSLVQFCLLMKTFPPSSTENPHLAYESGTCYLTPGKIYFKPKCWEDKLSWAFFIVFSRSSCTCSNLGCPSIRNNYLGVWK